jgi:6-phosphofructokinase 1
VVVSEGFDVGDIGASRDSFGHVSFGASDLTAQQAIVSHLNRQGLATTGKARGQIAGTDQRHAILHASRADLDEAYEVGRKAGAIAMDDGNGWMATILRKPGTGYAVYYDKVPLEQVANSERFFPESWIAESRTDVTDDFVNYARPLIGDDWVDVPLQQGLPRFTRFAPIFADKQCAPYVPQGYR